MGTGMLAFVLTCVASGSFGTRLQTKNVMEFREMMVDQQNFSAPTICAPGALCGTLGIEILEGKGLKAADFHNGSSDPYCVVKVNTKPNHLATWTTISKEGTVDPKWNLLQEFRINWPQDVLWQASEVFIEVWDKDPVSNDDFLGAISFPLPQGNSEDIRVEKDLTQNGFDALHNTETRGSLKAKVYFRADVTEAASSKKTGAKATCGSYKCTSRGWIPKQFVEDLLAPDEPKCCEGTCTAYECQTEGWIPQIGAATRRNPSEEICCEETCASYHCETKGWVKQSGVENTRNPSDEICCEETCASYKCQTDGWVKQSGVGSKRNPNDSKCCKARKVVEVREIMVDQEEHPALVDQQERPVLPCEYILRAPKAITGVQKKVSKTSCGLLSAKMILDLEVCPIETKSTEPQVDFKDAFRDLLNIPKSGCQEKTANKKLEVFLREACQALGRTWGECQIQSMCEYRDGSCQDIPKASSGPGEAQVDSAAEIAKMATAAGPEEREEFTNVMKSVLADPDAELAKQFFFIMFSKYCTWFKSSKVTDPVARRTEGIMARTGGIWTPARKLFAKETIHASTTITHWEAAIQAARRKGGKTTDLRNFFVKYWGSLNLWINPEKLKCAPWCKKHTEFCV